MKIRENVAYWCKTEKLSREFLQERQKEGIAWCDGCPASEKSPSLYFSSICYIVSKTSSFLEYETLGWFLAHGYEIVEYLGTKQESMENKIVSQPSSKDKEVTKGRATQSSILEFLADLIIDTAYQMRNSQAHLEHSSIDAICYGNIGAETNFIDLLGNKLKIGDTVLVYRNGSKCEEQVVCSLGFEDSPSAFIMGYAPANFKSGIATFVTDTYSIIKNRGYEGIKNGEVIGKVRYVLYE